MDACLIKIIVETEMNVNDYKGGISHGRDRNEMSRISGCRKACPQPIPRRGEDAGSG